MWSGMDRRVPRAAGEKTDTRAEESERDQTRDPPRHRVAFRRKDCAMPGPGHRIVLLIGNRSNLAPSMQPHRRVEHAASLGAAGACNAPAASTHPARQRGRFYLDEPMAGGAADLGDAPSTVRQLSSGDVALCATGALPADVCTTREPSTGLHRQPRRQRPRRLRSRSLGPSATTLPTAPDARPSEAGPHVSDSAAVMAS